MRFSFEMRIQICETWMRTTTELSNAKIKLEILGMVWQDRTLCGIFQNAQSICVQMVS